MVAKSKPGATRIVRFRNNDVPNYLKGLDQYEAWCRRQDVKHLVAV
jgi:hypothetical protein